MRGRNRYLLCRLEIVRFQENGWQEPYESRGSRTELWGTGGEIPPVYPTLKLGKIEFVMITQIFFVYR